jgi:hypothetical protein
VPGALQRFSQLRVIVDLAVEDDSDGAILVKHRLMVGRHVDDGEAALAKCALLLNSRQRQGRDYADTPSSVPALFDCVAR